MLNFFGSTDEKYILIDGDLEASVRVAGKAIFRIGDDDDGMYLNFTYHPMSRVWGAEVVPTGGTCNMLVSSYIDAGTTVVEICNGDKTPDVHFWDIFMQHWRKVEPDFVERT